MGTLTDTRFGNATLNGACVFSSRALEFAACDHVVISIIVRTLA